MAELVIRSVNGHDTFAIDYLGKRPLEATLFSNERRIPLTAEQCRWSLADLRHAYEFGML